MSNYLEFTDYTDKEYSLYLNESEDYEGDDYSVVSSAAKALVGSAPAKLKHETSYKRVHRGEGKGYRRTNALEKLKKRYQANRVEDGKGKVNDGWKDKRARAKSRIEERKGAGVLTPKEKALQGVIDKKKTQTTTVVAGAAGAAAGNLLMYKSKKKLAGLKSKVEKTPQDLEAIKKLKRKIAGITVASGAVSAVAGNLTSKELRKSRNKKITSSHR